MCIETQSLATALLPQFASEIGYDVQLMRLLSSYQLNPGTETYKAVKNYLSEKRSQQQQTLNTFNAGKRIDLNILDYENNLLWSTASLSKQDKIVLLYQASEYSQQATEGSAYQKFEDGSEYNLSWVSGGPLFTGGGAFKIGADLSNSTATTEYTGNGLTLYVTGYDTSGIYVDGSNSDTSNNYTYFVFTGDGKFQIDEGVIPQDYYVPINYFLVGGGGTGGNVDGDGCAGGGGGGGLLTGIIDYVGNNSNYITVTVGGGGSKSELDYSPDGTVTCNAGSTGGNASGSTNGNGGSSGTTAPATTVYTGGSGGDSGYQSGGGGAGTGADGSSVSKDSQTGGTGGNGRFPYQQGIPRTTSYYTSSSLFGAGGGGGGGYGGSGGQSGGGGGSGNEAGLSASFYGAGGGGGQGSGDESGEKGYGGFCVLSILSSYLE